MLIEQEKPAGPPSGPEKRGRVKYKMSTILKKTRYKLKYDK